MNNTSIGQCENCGRFYCLECSGDGYQWRRFCSSKCEREKAAEEKEEKRQEQRQADWMRQSRLAEWLRRKR